MPPYRLRADAQTLCRLSHGQERIVHVVPESTTGGAIGLDTGTCLRPYWALVTTYLAVLAFVGFMQVGQPLVTPPQNSTVTVHNEVTVQVPPPDPEATAQMAGWSFQGIIVTVMAPTLASWANALLDVPDFYRTTPADLTYGNSGVRALADIVKNVALGLVALIILGWGISKSLGQEPSYGRPIFGFVLAIGNLVWWQLGIDLNNKINAEISAPALSSIVKPHLALPTLTGDPSQAFGPALLVIAYAVVLILLLGSLFFRLGLIDILIAAGSLFLLCKGSDQTDNMFSTYVGTATGTLFSQIMVVIALKLAPVLGIGGAGLAGTILGLVVLLLARRMPGFLSSRFAASSGGGMGRMTAFVLLRRMIARV